jgi:high-affinity iron transporter
VVLAATRGVVGRRRSVWSGFLGGIFGAAIIAYFAKAISEAAEGMGQEVFNALILFLAAALIAWTVVWMARHGRHLTKEFQRVGKEVTEGRKPLHMLSLVVLLAVLREGSEIVLFTYGAIASGEEWKWIVVGSALGLVSGVAVGVLIYLGLIKISPKHVFGVTAWLLAFLASGMVSQALGYLTAAGFVPEIIPQVWDTSQFLSEKSWAGLVLHALLGYTDRPSGIQLIGYLTTLGGISMLLKSEKNSSNKKNTAKTIAAFVFLALLISPQNAWATKKVYSPHVEKGEWELEARGSYDFDDRESKGAAQKQKVAIGYGVTDQWFTEVYGKWEKDPDSGHGLEFTATQWENRFQISEPGAWFLDTGIYMEYEFASGDDHADKIEGKILLEKELGRFDHIVNLILEKEVNGPGREGDLEGGIAWSGRYRWKQYLEPGVEWHSEFGELDDTGAFDDQKHQVGPVFYGKIGDHVKYDIGYLFGISDAAPDGQLKWILEYEWRF